MNPNFGHTNPLTYMTFQKTKVVKYIVESAGFA